MTTSFACGFLNGAVLLCDNLRVIRRGLTCRAALGALTNRACLFTMEWLGLRDKASLGWQAE